MSSDPSSSSSSNSKENITVVVRCRPQSEQEKKENAGMCIRMNKEYRTVGITQNIAGKETLKNFTFDNVFLRDSTQREIYEQSIRPIVTEVLKGFNCTVFAYGQTGTGKTHTMEGCREPNSPQAGVIPRSIDHIFKSLEAENVGEYSVKVSYLELYNEELVDLLAEPEDVKPLRIFDDPASKKGVSVQNLEEVIVNTAQEIYKILDTAYVRRTTAETALNKQSSRSHGILTITIHSKETTPEGEELLKVGRLNLVDLAGSENIGRSKAVNQRAREAGMINQSLLTLGRVITALTENLGHVPYRESKLTRLLQESLGGRAKTVIIATITPSMVCMEETMSTLDYAFRAKHIKNRPEVNAKMTKKALLTEFSCEIDTLKMQLQAARAKNGIYLTADFYNSMEAKIKSQDEQITELEASLGGKMKEYDELKVLFDIRDDELQREKKNHTLTQSELEKCSTELEATIAQLQRTKTELDENIFMLKSHRKTETQLHEEGHSLLSNLSSALGDLNALFAKVERKGEVEASNRTLALHFTAASAATLEEIHTYIGENSKLRADDITRLSGETARAFAEILANNTIVGARVAELQQNVDGLQQQLCQSAAAFKERFAATATARQQSLVDHHVSQMQELARQLQRDVIEAALDDIGAQSARNSEVAAAQHEAVAAKLKDIKSETKENAARTAQLLDGVVAKMSEESATLALSLRQESEKVDELTRTLEGQHVLFVAEMTATMTRLLTAQQQVFVGAVQPISRSLTRQAGERTAAMQRIADDTVQVAKQVDAAAARTSTAADETVAMVDAAREGSNSGAKEVSAKQHKVVEECRHFIAKDIVAECLHGVFETTMTESIASTHGLVVSDFVESTLVRSHVPAVDGAVKDGTEAIVGFVGETMTAATMRAGAALHESLHRHNAEVASNMQGIDSRVDGLDKSLEEYQRGLRVDVTTGSTPVKRTDRKYPTVLSKTADETKLRLLFRSGAAIYDADADANAVPSSSSSAAAAAAPATAGSRTASPTVAEEKKVDAECPPSTQQENISNFNSRAWAPKPAQSMQLKAPTRIARPSAAVAAAAAAASTTK